MQVSDGCGSHTPSLPFSGHYLHGQSDSRSTCDVRRLIPTELLCRRHDVGLPVNWVGGAAVHGALTGCMEMRELVAECPACPEVDVTLAKEARRRALHCPCGAWALIPGPARRFARQYCQIPSCRGHVSPEAAQCAMHGDRASPEWKGTRAKMSALPHEIPSSINLFQTHFQSQKRTVQPSSSVFETSRKASAHRCRATPGAISSCRHDLLVGSPVLTALRPAEPPGRRCLLDEDVDCHHLGARHSMIGQHHAVAFYAVRKGPASTLSGFQ